jgi:predicted transglutaminase-like cysteine proteinase
MKYDDLEDVNREFNAYDYKADVDLDDWTPIDIMPDKSSDCDSYATAKAEKLIRMGWPKSALRLAICLVEDGGGHMVALADHENQTWVLDNRYPYPMQHELLKYKWLEFYHIDTGKWEKA